MQLIFDHLTAILVSAILLGVIMTLNVRGQTSAMEATQFHAAKARQSALIDMLEYDLEDLGSGVPAGEEMITEYDADAFGIKVFEFVRELADASGTPTLARVRYERSYEGSYTTGDGVTLPHFRIRRLIETGDGSMVSTTGDGFDVVALAFNLLGPGGETVTSDPNTATSIEVHLRSAFPFKIGDDLKFTSWTGTFRPSNLARRTGGAGSISAGNVGTVASGVIAGG